MLIFVGLFLAWIILPTKPEPVSIQPTDGLIEQVAGVEEFQTLLPGKMGLILHSVENAKHVPDAGKKLDHSVDATKKVDAKKEIVIFSIEGCKPCKDWVAIEQPKFQKAGWKVVKSDDPMTGPWPHFMIETSGKKIEYRSYLLFDKIDEVIK